jgi:hypothetical protein
MKKCDERKLEVLYVRQGVRTSRVNPRVRSVSDHFSPRVALEVQRRCIRTAADLVYDDTKVSERAEQYLRKGRGELSR